MLDRQRLMESSASALLLPHMLQPHDLQPHNLQPKPYVKPMYRLSSQLCFPSSATKAFSWDGLSK